MKNPNKREKYNLKKKKNGNRRIFVLLGERLAIKDKKKKNGKAWANLLDWKKQDWLKLHSSEQNQTEHHQRETVGTSEKCQKSAKRKKKNENRGLAIKSAKSEFLFHPLHFLKLKKKLREEKEKVTRQEWNGEGMPGQRRRRKGKRRASKGGAGERRIRKNR